MQAITSECEIMTDAIQGEFYKLREDAINPTQYLARLLVETIPDLRDARRQAEYRTLIELLADELGIKDAVLAKYNQSKNQSHSR